MVILQNVTETLAILLRYCTLSFDCFVIRGYLQLNNHSGNKVGSHDMAVILTLLIFGHVARCFALLDHCE